ncbi:MAG: hypothetical protein HZA50_02640 [Planctomycetes bacterium]|nr:hypothetical protein [Planctomycetota bacterium]
MPELLKEVGNEHVVLRVFDDASAQLENRRDGRIWRMGPVAVQEDNPIELGHVWLMQERTLCQQHPGRFRGRAEGDSIRYAVLGRLGKEMGTFTCRWTLEDQWIVLRIDGIDESLPSLIFPPPIESQQMVFPNGVGRLVRKPLPSRYFWLFYPHLNMKWFGGLDGQAGWIAVFDEGHADAGVLAGGLWGSPGWLKSLGRWGRTRGVRYRFTDGGYVGLAKAYRAWLTDNGGMRKLDEKMRACPALKNLLGGRILSIFQAMTRTGRRFQDQMRKPPPDLQDRESILDVRMTHAEVLDAVGKARRGGMKRGLVMLRGWCKGGYDELHPDIWPPEPALGSIDELRKLCSMGDPITIGLHDNYQDIYPQSPSFPKGVVRWAGGQPMPGGVWAGGQCYIVNSRDGLQYAKRNWPDIKTLNPRAMYIDTTTTAQLIQSYEQGNTLTRSQDEQCKIELLKFYKEQGLIIGSEEAADFGANLTDWQENRHNRVPGQSIPLWPLVFHDAAFCARYTYAPPDDRAAQARRWLTDMLWGYMPLWHLSQARFDDIAEEFAAVQYVDDWHGRVGAAEMTNHAYLTEDFQVERTEFSNGLAIAANFADQPRQVEGLTIDPAEYKILE